MKDKKKLIRKSLLTKKVALLSLSEKIIASRSQMVKANK